MIKTIKPVFFGLLCLAFASSCKKDVPNDNNAKPEGAVEKSADVSANGSYFPYTNGTGYAYEDTANGVSSTAAKSAIAILGDTTIDGKSFAKASAGGSSNFNYYNSTDGVTTLVNFNGQDKITSTVLKANEPVGAVWTDEFTNAGVPTTYEWKMVAKGMEKTVMGVTYKDVIQVHLTGTGDVPKQGKVVFADADYFYAPNVGMIENIGYNTVTGKTELRRQLKEYKKS